MTRPEPGWLDHGLYPFESRFVDVDGHTVHYVDEGTGPTLLMLHGNPTWSFVWRDVILALRDRYRCVAPDYPGFGLSVAADGYGFTPAEHAAVVGGFLRELNLEAVTLVLQDWGGPIGLACAEVMPERVSRLVIGNTWAWPVNGDPHFEIFSWMMGGPIGGPLVRRLNLFVNLLIPAGHRRRRVSRAEMAHYRAPFSAAGTGARQGTTVFPRSIIGAQEFLTGVERGLGVLASRPALIIWADRDIAFRAQERERWEASLPDHHTVVIGGAGHYVQSDAPAEFAAALDGWCSRER